MQAMRIGGKMESWLDSFFHQRTHWVTVGDSLSNPEIIRSGVLQSSVMGSIIFLIFVSDMGIKSDLTSFLYVNNSKVLAPINDSDDVNYFQGEMEKYYE